MKDISFQLGDQVVKGQLGSRITKRDLYGYAKTIAEKGGQPLVKGYLSADGQMFWRQELASMRFDPEGSPVEDPVTELDGGVAELQPSSFDVASTLTPVPLTRLAGFNVIDVYPLEGLALSDGLYETQFSYRKSYIPKEALLLVHEGTAYLFAGVTKKTTLVGLTVAYDFFDADAEPEDEDDDTLDFAMI